MQASHAQTASSELPGSSAVQSQLHVKPSQQQAARHSVSDAVQGIVPSLWLSELLPPYTVFTYWAGFPIVKAACTCTLPSYGSQWCGVLVYVPRFAVCGEDHWVSEEHNASGRVCHSGNSGPGNMTF